MVNFGDGLRKGLRFCIEPKRWLPLFVLDVAVIGIVLAVLLSGMGGMMDNMLLMETDQVAASLMAGYIIGLVLLLALWYVIRMWILGSLIYQSRRPREIGKAYGLSLRRLHKVIAATLLVAVISGIGGMVPIGGWVISLVIGWIFFFVLQGIMIDDLGIVSALKNSWKMFRRDPFDVFISWLLIAIISMFIVLAFALPLLLMFIGLFWQSMVSGTAEPGLLTLLFIHAQGNLPTVLVSGVIAIVGLDLSQAFAVKAQTEFYLQMRKKFPSIIKAFAKKVGRFF